MTDRPTDTFGFYHGATWMMPDGTMHIVPGFHDEWIHAHPSLTGDCKTVADLVIKKRWISVVVFAERYVEFCVNNRHDGESLKLLYRFLEKNIEKWENALIMTLEDDGYIQMSNKNFGGLPQFLSFMETGNRV